MRSTSFVLATMASLTLATSVHADGFAITPNFSVPLGLGLDLTYRLSPRFNLRAGGAPPITVDLDDFKYGDVKYDVKPKLGGVNAFLDWHPFAGKFHVGGGFVTVRDPWTFKATPVSTYKINGTTYSARDVGTLSGEHRFSKSIAPSLVVGWGNAVAPGRHWGFGLDVGLAYIGKDAFVLNADGPIANEQAFRRDLAEEQRLHSIDSSAWLTLRFGVSYQF